MEGDWSGVMSLSARPTVVSIPVAEGDPSDVEEDEDYDEEDNISGKNQREYEEEREGGRQCEKEREEGGSVRRRGGDGV